MNYDINYNKPGLICQTFFEKETFKHPKADEQAQQKFREQIEAYHKINKPIEVFWEQFEEGQVYASQHLIC